MISLNECKCIEIYIMSPTGENLTDSQLALSFFTVSEISVRSAEAQGHIPHLSPWEMIREKLIPRASWKPNHQPITSTGPKLQKYGDAAPKPVWRQTTRPKKMHKSWHSWLFRGCFLWFRSNCQRKAQREREREIYEAQSKSLVHLSLSLSGWKAILLVDWRMMLLLREQLHQLKERRRDGEGFLPRVHLGWWVSCQMPHCPNYPASTVSPPGTHLQRSDAFPTGLTESDASNTANDS